MRRFLIGLAGIIASATVAANAQDRVIESEENVLNPVVACRSKDDFLALYRSSTGQQLPDMVAPKITSGACVTLLKDEVVRVKINPPIADFLQATRLQDGADYYTYVNAFTRRWAEKTVLVPVLACRSPGAFFSYHALMTHTRAKEEFTAAKTAAGECIMLQEGEVVELDYQYLFEKPVFTIGFAKQGDTQTTGDPGAAKYRYTRFSHPFYTYAAALLYEGPPTSAPGAEGLGTLTDVRALRPALACKDELDLFSYLGLDMRQQAPRKQFVAPKLRAGTCVMLKQGEHVRLRLDQFMPPWTSVVRDGDRYFAETVALVKELPHPLGPRETPPMRPPPNK